MSESISEFLLTQVINYGAPLFALNLFLGAAGLPVGASFTLIAVGAFSQQGYFSWVEMAVFGLVGALIGDALSFGMGHFARDAVHRRFGRTAAWVNAKDYFYNNAWKSIFFTRFLITALAIPINLIAGGSGYKFSRFIAPDILGELIWIIVYGGLGYLFGTQWETVSEIVSDFGGLLLGLVLLVIGFRLGRRWLALHRSVKAKVHED
ncbi:MAG: VTT domain-containing protein [Chloroflexota bacterium]